MGEKNTFSYKSFEGSMEVSAEDQCLYGEVLFIKDTIVYHGATFQELEAAFRIAVDDYIQDCAALNRDPNKPFSGSFNIRIGSELHRSLALFSFKKNISINNAVTQAVEMIISNEAEKETIGFYKTTIEKVEIEKKWKTDKPKLSVVK